MTMRGRLLALAAVVLALLPAGTTRAAPLARDGKYTILTRGDLGAINARTPVPPYPWAYRARAYEAAMRLRIYISPDGKIDDVKIVKFFGDPAVGTYAVRKVKETFKFSSPVLNGNATAVCFDMPVIFLVRPPIGPVSRVMLRDEPADALIDRVGKAP